MSDTSDTERRLDRVREALAVGDLSRAEHEAAEALARDPACAAACQALAETYIRGGSGTGVSVAGTA